MSEVREGDWEKNKDSGQNQLTLKTDRKEKENQSYNTGYMKSPTAREQKMVPEKVLNLEIAIKD